MLEGFVHLKERLSRDNVKKLVSMNHQYMGYSKKILFVINDDVDDVKEHLLRRFRFIRDSVDKIVVFLNDKTDSSKTFIFNYKND